MLSIFAIAVLLAVSILLGVLARSRQPTTRSEREIYFAVAVLLSLLAIVAIAIFQQWLSLAMAEEIVTLGSATVLVVIAEIIRSRSVYHRATPEFYLKWERRRHVAPEGYEPYC